MATIDMNNDYENIVRYCREYVNNRNLRIKNTIIALACAGLLSLGNTGCDVSKMTYAETAIVEDYTNEDIYRYIYASSRLTDDEKLLLYNANFFNDVLSVVNKSLFLKQRYQIYLDNIGISNNYDWDSISEKIKGRYDRNISPNTLFVKNYTGLTKENSGTVIHEFVHSLQCSNSYNLITEASAEIAKNEYYGLPIETYFDQIKILKILMEIIGPEVIWEYNFTGDFSKIENIIRPCLTDSEYNEFLDGLTFDTTDDVANRSKTESMFRLLEKIYHQIYGNNMEDNKIISLIRSGEKSLVTYYFNKSYNRLRGSYYYDTDLGSYDTVSIEYAIEHQLIHVYAQYEEPISKEEALAFVPHDNYMLRRDIDYSSANIIYKGNEHGDYKDMVRLIIDGEEFYNVDLDDLVREGYLDVHYTLVYSKKLTVSDYVNHDYLDVASLIVSKPSDAIVNLEEGTVYAWIPKQVYLDSVNSRRLVLKR